MQRDGARRVDCLFPLIGHIYAAAGHYFGPYKKPGGADWDLGVAGSLWLILGSGPLTKVSYPYFKTFTKSSSQVTASWRSATERILGHLKAH